MFIYFMHTMPGTASCSPRPLHHCTTQISTTYMHSNKMHHMHGAFRQDILRHVISYIWAFLSAKHQSVCTCTHVCASVYLCVCVQWTDCLCLDHWREDSMMPSYCLWVAYKKSFITSAAPVENPMSSAYPATLGTVWSKRILAPYLG